MPQHSVRLRCSSHGEVLAPTVGLEASVEELHPAHLAEGTKRAMLKGGGLFSHMLAQHKQAPHLTLPGSAWTLLAPEDHTSQLEDPDPLGGMVSCPKCFEA